MSEPVEERYQKQLYAIGNAIDKFLNPSEDGFKKIGFVILMFSFDNKQEDRMNYLSNAQRGDVIRAMKEFIDNMTLDESSGAGKTH